jgi:pyruvate formate lyase activating enzyme
MKGYIHSIDSFGTVDGPGIRFVVFMQGCPMRCLYCHNPDTWEMNRGREAEPWELIAELKKNASFYRKGGITVTGGEPLCQVEFVTELFRLAREEGIHTCLDTSGITYSQTNADHIRALDGLMEYTDLVMLDIKHIDPERHRALTGRDNAGVLDFARYLDTKNIPIWVRHVVLSGYTDDPESLRALGGFIKTLKNVTALDVLPYHTLGVQKYKALGIPYPLDGIPPLDKAEAARARQEIVRGMA